MPNADLHLGTAKEAEINLRQNEKQQEYNSEEQRNVYEGQPKSFNEQKQNYVEKEIGLYNYEEYVENVSRPDEFGRINYRTNLPENNPLGQEFIEEGLEPLVDMILDDNEDYLKKIYDGKQKNIEKSDSLRERSPSVKHHSIKDRRLVERRLDEEEYKALKKRRYKTDRRIERGVSLLQARKFGRLLFDDENMKKDKDSAAVDLLISRTAYKSARRIKKSIRNIQDKQYIYNRLKIKDGNNKLFDKEIKRLDSEKKRIIAVNRKISEFNRALDKGGGADNEAVRRDENRKIQQRNKQRRKLAQEKSRINREKVQNRIRLQHNLNKNAQKERRITRKRNMTVISSLVSIVGTLLLVFLVVVLFLMSFFDMFAHITTKTVTQNDYAVLTDVTGYLRDLETNVKRQVTTDREETEKELDEKYFEQTGRHIYEFVYNLPDFSFDDITLMSYLSVKFFSFDLEAVQTELEELCKLMYMWNVEFREEERTFYNAAGNPYTEMVIICYITIDKTELEEIVEVKLDEAELEQYKAYKISGGGQRIYGPVMDVDWSSKISSNFGERIHPITGKKTFHDGIDIAVPTGTRLYAAITGQIVTAHYSTSAGNMVTIRTDSGWEVTYMHMDSLNVNAGQYILKGQLIGYSGNTGNSTGPHLHIQVHDTNGRQINPIFIIPQSGVTYN